MNNSTTDAGSSGVGKPGAINNQGITSNKQLPSATTDREAVDKSVGSASVGSASVGRPPGSLVPPLRSGRKDGATAPASIALGSVGLVALFHPAVRTAAARDRAAALAEVLSPGMAGSAAGHDPRRLRRPLLSGGSAADGAPPRL